MSIRNKALDLLARREHSRYELKNKLLLRFPDGQQYIERVIESLERENLLCDHRFTEMFIRVRAAKGNGPVRVASELREKGVEASMVESVLTELDIPWCAVLKALWLKKYGEASVIDPKESAKRFRYLQNKGYTPELIKQVLPW